MPNASLINSLSFSMTSIAEDLASDTLFSATSTGGTVSMMINFGENTNIGYFLVIGEPPGHSNSYNNPNGKSCYITFGNSADPKKNPIIYTAGTYDWAKEVQINRSG
jgi:hypothetical protein